MTKKVIIFSLLSLWLSGIVWAQDGTNARGIVTNSSTDNDNVSATVDQSKRIAVLKSSVKMNSDFQYSPLIEYQLQRARPPKVEQKTRFNIVSSFRENIHFGGMWDRYAIVNFTPSVNIKPFDFISINANQNLSCFVPISGIKEHFKILSIQGAAILAVDNTFKLLFGQNKIIQPLVAFALKVMITSIAMKYVNVDSKNRIYSYNSYSYSMHITF